MRAIRAKPIAIAAALFAVAEFVWLTSMRPFYKKRFAAFSGPLKLRSVAAAVSTYALLLLGAFVFVAMPALTDRQAWRSAARGALFGGVVYGVYNLTNKSTIDNYPWSMVAVDTAWGATLFGGLALACNLTR